MLWQKRGERLYIGTTWLGEVCGLWWKNHEEGHTNALNRLLHVFMWADEDVGARLFAGALLANLTVTREQARYGLFHLDVLWALTDDGVRLPVVLRNQVLYVWQKWETLYLRDDRAVALDEIVDQHPEIVVNRNWWEVFVGLTSNAQT